jgi:hypothetical protein
MFRWLVVCGLLCGGAIYLVKLSTINAPPIISGNKDDVDPLPTDEKLDQSVPRNFARFEFLQRDKSTYRASPIVIQDGRIAVYERQEVPSDRDGQILFFGTELKKGEEALVPPNRIITQRFIYIAVEVDYKPNQPSLSYPLAGAPNGQRAFHVPILVNGENNYFYLDSDAKTVYTRWKENMPLYANRARIETEVRKFRKLEEQDHVEKGDLLALINPELAITDLHNKNNKLQTAEADRVASEKTREEAKSRYAVLVELKAKNPGAVSAEELRTADLQVSRYTQEEIAKGATVRAAEYDLVAAMKVVGMHEVRAASSGVVKTIYKNRGDGVRANTEPLMQIVNTSALRVESLAEVQDARKLTKGQLVKLEVSTRMTPNMTLGRAQSEITAVAVSNGKPRLIIAAGEDQSLRGWDAADGQPAWVPVHLPSPVRVMACTRKGAVANLLLTGSADGTAHIIDLTGSAGRPIALPERHRGPITAVAFSADGKTCATGGDDRAIILWSYNPAKREWERSQRVPDAHRNAVTSLAFTSQTVDFLGFRLAAEHLISAGRDNTLTIWEAQAGKALIRGRESNRRSGDVAQLGTDGQRVLFDQGKELKVLSLRDGRIEGTLRIPSGTSAFSTMALFSPDGRTILTDGAEGKPQLWRAPRGDAEGLGSEGRGSVLRELASNSPATSGAFDPDGAFAVTGTQDGQVLVWDMPTEKEIHLRIPATISLVEQFQDSAGQVKVWAELRETPDWLVPGSAATIVVRPEEGGK